MSAACRFDFLRIDGRLGARHAVRPIERAMVESIQRVGHLMAAHHRRVGGDPRAPARRARARIDAAQVMPFGRGAPLDEAFEPRAGVAGTGTA